MMRALELYSGAGGATRGLQQGGFRVTGVDLSPQPNFCCDEFVLRDALEYLARADLCQFDFLWASPPCQRYASLKHAPGKHRDAEFIAPSRALLERSGKPYAIENVEGAPLINPIMLCGSMFGLGLGGFRLQRHRLLETLFFVLTPGCVDDGRPVRR
jgi:DNA (cytosine-5)-methyltransferase 1